MRLNASTVCPILTRANAPRAAATRSAFASAVLGAALLAAGCPKIISRHHNSTPPSAPVDVTQSAQPAQAAQTGETGFTSGQPNYSYVYCSGFLKDTPFSRDLSIISGEHSSYKVVFYYSDYVYLTQGADKGVKVGDRFMVVRPDADPSPVEWFKGQAKLENAIGVHYRDLGQIRVVNVQPKTSIAQVVFSCDYMQRGDTVRPFEERPAPPFHDGTFDRFAPVSGKPVGMIVESREWGQAPQQGNVAFVNLGAAQGVKIGDYLRIFRHEGDNSREYIPTTKGTTYEMYGFGSAPERYTWKDLPREVLGEGIVLNASRNGSTMLITTSLSSIFVGDNVEIE